ncbi:protein crumbs homolog 1 isoform X2 [Hyla sarda]|uniref:protein crumbs homolog 1 isoform X2 n=1 Tax=Hyla sarda TaxID=327740 RepID=UPI0024C422B2|nr:protein crumbs homolog 1 isoform X2 [Hyla sarda]
MEQPRVSWTHVLYLVVLMYLQVTRTIGSRNTTNCSSPLCRDNLSCSSPTGCGSLSDPCLSDPCPRNATCQVTLDTETYECRCPAGFKGRSCEIPMKQCFRNLCRHGGQCYVTERGSTCACAVGYKGTFCETPEDECLWNPCHNGAVCRERGNGQACYCVPGFQGALCDIEVNECISQPCQHGGTCLNQIGRYSCVCPPEYTGRDCELEYNACTSQPCVNGATCLDNAGSFSCHCAAGFSGDLCDVNINECASSPCLNGGHCVDEIAGYICDCSMVGYTGVNCEAPAPLCSSQPCQNIATCLEDSGSFQCLCWPGYTGPLCESYIPMCKSQPCMHGAECQDLTWFNMSQGQVNEQDKSKGYICKCRNGFLGVHCEQDINECESNPCRNGGTCVNLLGGYICRCPTYMLEGRYYGGPDCTQVLMGCEEHICQNGGTCIPSMIDNEHPHTCLCALGFTGPYCETQTTLSFNGRTILTLTLPSRSGEPFNVSVSFQTVQTSASILHLRGRETALRLYLQNGSLFLSLHRDSHLDSLLHLPYNVSDDLWHTVEIISQDDLCLKLLDPSCGMTCVNQSGLRDASTIEFQEMFFGGEPSAPGKQETGITDKVIRTQFVGCLRDIKVGSIIVTEEDGKLTNIGVGCKRCDHCESHPCGHRGECINLWLSYYCDCHRPYRGDNCSAEYEAAGFGYGNASSYAVLQTRIGHNDDATMSAFVRTKHDMGVLFAIGDSVHYEIIVFLESGKLTARTGNGVQVTGKHSISDGQDHLLNVKLTENKLDVWTSSQPLDSISIQINRERDLRFLYIGGLDDQLETIKWGGHFKGCIQDLRINGAPQEFFTGSENSGNVILVNLTRGCLNDTSCKPGLCQNGSACTDGNDCSCSSNTQGKTCEDLKWCQLTQCPSGSVCQPVPGGYECISNALFHGNGQAVSFRSNGKIMRDLTNLTIGFRTVDSESVLLHAQREPEIIRVNIRDTFLHFHLQSSNGLDAVSLLSKESVSDSRWHTVTLSMTAPGSQSSTWQMEIDGKPEKTISSLTTGNLNFLKEGTEIYLGVDKDGMKSNFTGCLGTVLIEGIHLPYFADSDYLMVKPQAEQFVKTSPEIVDIRCLASDPCASNPCMFGGSCRDVFTHPVCTCPEGRSGDVCETKTTECLPNPCAHGNCTIEADGYKCECEAGYTGPNCDYISCNGHLCAKGATCTGGANGFYCLCPPNVTGQHCRFNVMPSIFCGDEKKNITCYNYSNCTEVQGVLGCSCKPGFTGERCEIDIDECESNPCLNGGICQNLPNRFHCICDMNFAGDNCEIDLSDFLPPGVFTAVASAVLALFFAVCAGLCIFIAIASMRSSQGTYSPSRQEKEGSRVEMWNIVQPPPLERLI